MHACAAQARSQTLKKGSANNYYEQDYELGNSMQNISNIGGSAWGCSPRL